MSSPVKTYPALGKCEGRVVITHPLTPIAALNTLQKHFDVVVLQNFPTPREEILEAIKGADGILWVNHTPLNAEALDAAGPQLKALSALSAGLDYVDVAEVKRRGIPMGYTPNVLDDAVADAAIGLMIAAGRRFHEADLHIRRGCWRIGELSGTDIRGSRVGIVGLGNIGQKIVKRLSGFEVGEFVYSGRTRKSAEVEEKCNARYVSFVELIQSSDFVFIAAPLTTETRNMFDASVFDQMKHTAVLVNIGRGAIVNTEDLVVALREKKIFAAGLDVMDPEPLPTNHPLLSLENVVLTPHIATATPSTHTRMAEMAAMNVIRGIKGEEMIAPIP